MTHRALLFMVTGLLATGLTLPLWADPEATPPANFTPTPGPWAFTAPSVRSEQLPQGTEISTVDLNREARAHVVAAQSALQSNRLDEAAREIQQALVEAPDHPTVLSLAGRIFTRQRSFGLAANCWRQLLSSFPGQFTLRAELGGTLLYMGREKEARAEIEEAVTRSPGDLTARYYRAMLAVYDRQQPQATDVFSVLNGSQILQTVIRLQEDRDLVIGLTSTEGYRSMARALLNSTTITDPVRTLAEARALLERLRPAMQANRWAEAAPLLESLRASGANYPALAFDLGLCRYWLNPGPATLDSLEALLTSPGGAAFVRYFAYLCLTVDEAARAERAVNETLKQQPDLESLLIQAAIRQGLHDEAGAWTLLLSIPAEQRPAVQSWFDRPAAPIQQLRTNAAFSSWLKPKPSDGRTDAEGRIRDSLTDSPYSFRRQSAGTTGSLSVGVL
jgi:tetratricopeptide (TPR) repeat protein